MDNNKIRGIFLTSTASLWWGIIGVIYFKFISFANPVEIIVHRTIWTALLLFLLIALKRKIFDLIRVLKNKRNFYLLTVTGLLVMTNWLTWVYSLKVDKLLDASLGYYIYPIISVFFGVIFLKEKINMNKKISILLVFFSLLWLLVKYGNIPWIGIIVALTFSLYGLIRKKINVKSEIGLLSETIIITPIALIAFYYLYLNNLSVFSFSKPIESFYLFWAGLVTLVPLYLYTRGFEIVGIGPASMIFFLTPTSQFFLSIFLYNEPLGLDKLISFIFIWVAVLIYLNELRKE